nr:hypothetical protein [uncultured Actinoplanes sp.]
MTTRRITTMMATLLAVTGLGACADPATESQRTGRAEIAAEVRTSAHGAVAAARTDPTVRNVPSAFRLPPGSRVTALSDREAGASFTLTAPDPQAVLAFYRRELGRGTFTIVTDRTDDGATSLSFRDRDGWAGAIFATTHRVTVAVRRA